MEGDSCETDQDVRIYVQKYFPYLSSTFTFSVLPKIPTSLLQINGLNFPHLNRLLGYNFLLLFLVHQFPFL